MELISLVYALRIVYGVSSVIRITDNTIVLQHDNITFVIEYLHRYSVTKVYNYTEELFCDMSEDDLFTILNSNES
jgi:hypothetical protein